MGVLSTMQVRDRSPPQRGQVLHQEGQAWLLRGGHAQAGVPEQAVREYGPPRVQDVQQRRGVALRAHACVSKPEHTRWVRHGPFVHAPIV